MSHVRTQIRTAIAAYLVGLAATGANVFRSRRRPVSDSKLPCLLVYLDDEDIEAATVSSPLLLDRKPELRIVGCAKDADGVDDVLDQILLEVEAAMAAAPDPTFGGLIQQLASPTSVRVSADDDALEKPAGAITITYPLNYFTAADDPATAL